MKVTNHDGHQPTFRGPFEFPPGCFFSSDSAALLRQNCHIQNINFPGEFLGLKLPGSLNAKSFFLGKSNLMQRYGKFRDFLFKEPKQHQVFCVLFVKTYGSPTTKRCFVT